MAMTIEDIQNYHKKLPSYLFKYINKEYPFVFCDFEVFQHDWMLCFSTDGINIKTIINDVDKLKHLFLNNFTDRILIGYNCIAYDKCIMLALLNDLDPKQISDELINSFNFNFNFEYGSKTPNGKELTWYDPMTRNAGSLKAYEACCGENIYESNVSFDIDRPLTNDEIEETIKYCSFDVQMVIKYFYEVMFEWFLGHIGLVDQVLLKKSNSNKFCNLMSRTDASLVGTLLCTDMKPDRTGYDDKIKLPSQFDLGKYKNEIEKFLEIPIRVLKNGVYNSLNSWSLKIIDKSLNRGINNEILEKLKIKEEKIIKKLKKLKNENITLLNKPKLTEKQTEKLKILPEMINKAIQDLNIIRDDITNEIILKKQLKILLNELKNFEKNTLNYNHKLAEIIKCAKVSNHWKVEKLLEYLKQRTQADIDYTKYTLNKKDSPYNDVLIQYSFEVLLNIKGIEHQFKTGGIHSVANNSMFFDKTKNKNKTLIIADVNSLYPNLMVNFGLCSVGMTDIVNGRSETFAKMINDRIVLKLEGDPFANVLKIILNTTYGCMGSEYNPLYDPSNRLKVCIYGQVAIVDLLDKLEDKIQSLEIYQSNTDGIIISCDIIEEDNLKAIIKEWENRTGLGMSYDPSVKLCQKDVSNYILVSEEIDKKTGENKLKCKGIDVGDKNAHNNSLLIINKALRNYFTKPSKLNPDEPMSFHETVAENQNLIDYQIIKKRTSKTMYVNRIEDANGIEYVNLPDKVIRLFPVTENCKDAMRIFNTNGSLVPEVPTTSILVKENIIGKTISDIPDFDINYYREFFNDKLEQWMNHADIKSDDVKNIDENDITND